MSAVPPGAEGLTLTAAIERAASTNGVPDAAAIYVVTNAVRTPATLATTADAVLSLALHRLAPFLAGIGARGDLRARMQHLTDEAQRTLDLGRSAGRRREIVEAALRELVTPRPRRDSAEIPLPVAALIAPDWFRVV
jgi:hypothetical protein